MAQRNPSITVGAEMDWPPFDFAIAGRATGLSNAYVELLASKVGLKVDYVVGPPFSELIQMAQDRKVDLMPALWKNAERQQYLDFLEPYYQTTQVVFHHKDIDSINHIDDLRGLRLVGVSGYNNTQQLKNVLVIKPSPKSALPRSTRSGQSP